MNEKKELGEDTQEFVEKIYNTPLYEQLKAKARQIAGAKAAKVDASGLVVDAVLRALNHRHTLHDEGSLRGWLTTIVVNEVLAKLRLAEIRTQALPEEDELPAARSEEAAKDEEKAYMLGLLEQLSEADRTVICLCKLQNLPYAEIAALLTMNDAAVRQRLSRAMSRLKKIAKKSLVEGGRHS